MERRTEQRDHFLQISGGEVSRRQQERMSGYGDECRDRSRFETRTKQEKSSRKMCEVSFLFVRKIEDWSEKVAQDGLGPRESLVSPGSWNGAYGKTQVEETYGGCSIQEGIGDALALRGCE